MLNYILSLFVYLLSSDVLIIRDLFCIRFSIQLICPPHSVDPNPDSCVFCKIDKSTSHNILFMDHEFIAFSDINPSAHLHFLVVPRQHLGTVNLLSHKHVSMLKRMKEIATMILKERAYNSTRIGFHLPPFNSIYHLHLHGIGKPFKNAFRALKYPKFETPWWTSVFIFM